MAQESILVIQLRQLGDILLTTPCLKAIKAERPKATVTFLSHRMGRLVLDGNPYLDEHFFYDQSWSKWDEWRLAKTLRSRRFDLVLDFMNNPRSAFYSFMSGAPERVAFRSARRLAYTTTVNKPEVPGYIVREKFTLLEAVGFKPDDARLLLPWHEVHIQPLMTLWGESEELRRAPLRVVLSPTHRREIRRWPIERYAALADLLVERWGAFVLWLWGPGEEELVDQAIALCRQRTHKAPPTSFREMVALIANMDLFIGNSNGPSHVAVATDICSLQLHGHTDARSWCPMNDRHRALQAPEFGKVARPDLGSLTLEKVWEALQEMEGVVRDFHARREGRLPLTSWRSRAP